LLPSQQSSASANHQQTPAHMVYERLSSLHLKAISLVQQHFPFLSTHRTIPLSHLLSSSINPAPSFAYSRIDHFLIISICNQNRFDLPPPSFAFPLPKSCEPHETAYTPHPAQSSPQKQSPHPHASQTHHRSQSNPLPPAAPSRLNPAKTTRNRGKNGAEPLSPSLDLCVGALTGYAICAERVEGGAVGWVGDVVRRCVKGV
jgi:hypothetical protein